MNIIIEVISGKGARFLKKKSVRIRRIISAVICVCIFASSMLFLHTSAAYNDKEFEKYINLTENSSVPNLFRNDSVFGSYKKYPPVISGGIEYVPLEIFYGLSGVNVTFSADSTNFYIQNKRNSKYLSFSIPGNYAVSNNRTIHDISAKTFYGAYYVPLRSVCQITGIGCDSFNDSENNIYVIKVYTVSGLSAEELIKINAPDIYTVKTEEPEPPPPVVKPDDEEKEETFGTRVIYLSFVGSGLSNGNKVLNTLSQNKIKATFFVTYDDILAYPETLRKIYTAGHTIGIAFSESAAELCRENGIEESIIRTEDALYEILKTKTRLVYLDTNANAALYKDADINNRIEAMGLRNVKMNVDAKTGVLGGAAASAAASSAIKNLEVSHKTTSAYVRLTFSESARTVCTNLAKIASEQRGVSFSVLDEASVK